MKKLMMAAVALFITAGMVQAQDSRTSTQTPAPDKQEVKSASDATPQSKTPACDMNNCLMKKGGKLFQTTGGVEAPVTADVKLKNGMTVSAEGIYVTRDGKKVMMNDGDCMDMNGNTCVMKNDHHDHNHDHHNH